MQLINKHILITGGTSGIGLKIIEKLYPQNIVYVIARNATKIDALRQRFPKLKAYHADLANNISLYNAIKTLQSDTKTLDILINNAAIQHANQLTDKHCSVDAMHEEISVNFAAICSLCFWCLPMLASQQTSIILNVNSGLGLVPKGSSAVYCATKSALNSFSLSLRHQLTDTSVKVLQAFLPMVKTPMTEGRGSNKISADSAASAIIKGIENLTLDNDIGKVKLLRILSRLSPSMALRIMRKY